MNEGICRGCGARIGWVKLKSGKNMPVDLESIDPDFAEIGDVLVTESGRVVTVGSGNDSETASETCYVSHFATCAKGDEFRRTKNAGYIREEFLEALAIGLIGLCVIGIACNGSKNSFGPTPDERRLEVCKLDVRSLETQLAQCLQRRLVPRRTTELKP